MNLSGILVVATPPHMAAVVAELDALPGVEVHHTDPPSGRIIVVQEAESIDDEVAGLKRIKQLPHVVMAEMAYHYFAEDPQNYPPERVEALDRPAVPDYLTADNLTD
ncbi:MAG: chaperone NapD [Gammaproteobacteria bacterium]|nr:chaperone NapD [Gammaproteobacteria bacterium]